MPVLGAHSCWSAAGAGSPSRRRGVAIALLAMVVVVALAAPRAAAATAPDAAFTNTFASLSGAGWVGGDATNSVALPDGRDCWIFSDTITSASPAAVIFVHNSIVVTGNGPPKVIENPMPAPAANAYYWAGAARVRGRQIWEIAERMVQTGSGLWDYHLAGDYLAKLSISTWHTMSITPLPGTGNGTINWGVALLDYGPYTYIYGSEFRDSKQAGGLAGWMMHLARVAKGRLDTPWSYDTASGWKTNASAASRRLLGGVSPAFSVVNLGARRGIRLVSQQWPLGQEIDSWRAATPAGPFTKKHAIYNTGSMGPRTYTYNTLAHPEQTNTRGMLFSYNVNSWDALTSATASLYRPRFFRVPTSAL